MSILDKLRKKRNTKIVNIIAPKKEDEPPIYSSLKTQNVNQDDRVLVGTKGRTFVRLDELKKLIEQQQQTINELKKQVNDLVLHGSPNAKYVLDTYDNQYKNVKDIQINYAFNADKLKIPGTSVYASMNDLEVKQAKYADTSGVTNTVKYNNGTYTMDQLLLNFVPSSVLKEGVQFDTYEKFREYINRIIK